MINTKDIKHHFPILTTNQSLVYLDSAATALTPCAVTEKMNEYYENYGVNIHRGLYALSEQATNEYEAARAAVARFINAKNNEIIFTSGTTQGLNMLADSLARNLKAQDNIVLTLAEHHANLVPWQEAAKRYGFELRLISLTPELEIDLESGKKLIDENTKIVSFAQASNSTGMIAPAAELIALAKEHKAITIVDAAQSIVHLPIDVKTLDCDFLVFSGHKLYGPTGIGVLYGKEERLQTLSPFFFGGDMVLDVTENNATWTNIPHKFEAGTPNIAGAIGLGAAIDFIELIGKEEIFNIERELVAYTLSELQKISNVRVLGSHDPVKRVPVISFVIDGVHPHDVAEIFNRDTIAIRAGHHCTMPLMKSLNISGTARLSIGMYTTGEDIDRAMNAIKEVTRIFKEQTV